MPHYQLKIAYRGTNYFGWQDLGASESKPTVQATILEGLRKICKYQQCTVSGASRTDAGVHAQGQVAKITIPREIVPAKLLQGLNSLMPDDIRILECDFCPADFNPNRDAVSKEYHYYLSFAKVENPILHDVVYHVPLLHEMSVDMERMNQACSLFTGEHDFDNFSIQNLNKMSTIRRVFTCEIQKAEFSSFGDDVYFMKIEGNGFLRQMIRYIVGAVINAGTNQLPLADIAEALKNQSEGKINAKVKARGLHLISIQYER